MENNIFDYSSIRTRLCNMNYWWDEILEEYKKIHDFSDFEATYITGLYGNKDNNKVSFYHICNRCIVEWNYCFESKKIINEIHRMLDVTDVALETKLYNETELKLKIRGRDINLNNFDTNGGISLKLKENIIKFYKVLLSQL